jgi:hypothetical protein
MGKKKALKNELFKQQQNLETELENYKDFEFKDSFAGVQAPTLGAAPASSLANIGDSLTNFSERLTNPFAGAQNFQRQRENTAEDLTIDQRQAQFIAQQQQQALSQTLQSQRQAAGSSGAAALAQAVAGVQSQNLQSAAASIGQQESAINQQRASQAFTLQGAVASEASANQQRAMAQEVANQRAVAAEAAGYQGLGVEAQFLGAQQQQARDLTGAQMDFSAQQIRAQGADLVQQRQFDRDATLLGIQAQRTAGAGADLQNLYNRRAEILGSVMGAVGSAAEGAGNALAASAIAGSDRRLKKNIKFLTKSNKGFNVYTFEYKNKKYGDGIYQGVMSDEIPRENIIINKDGYDMVNYSNLDVEFKRI